MKNVSILYNDGTIRKEIAHDVKFNEGWLVLEYTNEFLRHGDDPKRPRLRSTQLALPSQQIKEVEVVGE